METCRRREGDGLGEDGLGEPTEVGQHPSLPSLFEAMLCCTRCPLAQGRSRVVPGVGPSDAELMLIGEGPGAQEDREGTPFVGRGGQLLDRLLEGAGLRRDEVFITNVVACRPPRNRTPRVREVRAHAPWLEEQLRLVAPRVVCTLGRSALVYFEPGGKITELHGRPRGIERDGEAFTLLPTFHPAAVLRQPTLLPAVEADLRVLASLLGRG